MQTKSILCDRIAELIFKGLSKILKPVPSSIKPSSQPPKPEKSFHE